MAGRKRKAAAGAAALSAVALATLMGTPSASAADFDCDPNTVGCGGGGGFDRGDPFQKWYDGVFVGNTDSVFGKFVPAVQNAFSKIQNITLKLDESPMWKVDDVFFKYDAFQKID